MTRNPYTGRFQTGCDALLAWSRDVALPLIEEEHQVAHDSFKDPRRPRSHAPECKPYLDAIAGYRRAVKGGQR